MYSLNREKRRSALIATYLLMLLLISAGLTFYLYGQYSHASAGYLQYYSQAQMLNITLQQVNATAPKVTVTLSFTATPPAKNVKPETVTFLTGYLTVTDLTEILTPALLTVYFNVTHTTTNPQAQIEYSWIPSQTVYLLKGIETVEIPAGIFPLTIRNAKPGDQIIIFLTARVQITWQPVGALMTDQTITTHFTIYVVKP